MKHLGKHLAYFLRAINRKIYKPGYLINRVYILRNYHDQAIIISMSNVNESLSGMIVDDSLIEKVYFKDLKAIEYQ